MMRLSALIVLAALVGPATSFESAELKRRRKAKKEAVSYLNVDGWTGEAAQCAACEATARQMEDKMRTGQHKTGEVERLGLLMEVCDGIETQLPMKLAPVEKGGPDVLHFFRNDNAMAELKREGGGPIDLSKLGLLEFCNAVVEEWEEELAEVMDNAKPTMAKFGASLYGKPISNYELKVDVCVKATGLCAGRSSTRSPSIGSRRWTTVTGSSSV
jgi:bacterioferritin-associated ferredoxin